MGLVPKFRNGKRCRRKLEKQNIQLKPEMTDYLCNPKQILQLLRYSLTFNFPWPHPSLHSPWYPWHICSSNMTWIQVLFWLGNSQIDKACSRCASHFLFCARLLWRSATCKWNGIQCACAPGECVPLRQWRSTRWINVCQTLRSQSGGKTKGTLYYKRNSLLSVRADLNCHLP